MGQTPQTKEFFFNLNFMNFYECLTIQMGQIGQCSNLDNLQRFGYFGQLLGLYGLLSHNMAIIYGPCWIILANVQHLGHFGQFV